jgi:hypothetical protein
MEKMKEKETKPEDKSILMQEYCILVDLIKHQHTRVQDFDKTFLTANTILIGACAVLLGGKGPKLFSYLIPLCLLGITVSFVWICVSLRMRVDSDLRWFQLRTTERLLMRPNGIFTSGHAFFKDKLLESPDGQESPLKFPNGFNGLIARFRVVWVGMMLPFLFTGLYSVLIYLGKQF